MNIRFNSKNIIVLSFIFFTLLYFRRGYQLLYPDVWQEDLYNVTSFIQNGWMNLFEPVAGYLITVPKLITNISMSISFIYYPEISTYLTWIFTIFVALAVVYSPTHLKYPLLASILIFFIPTDAEVFGLPLYTFWFSTILLFLVALWKSNEKQVFKNIFLFVGGGVSSPVIVLMVPILMFRSIVLKNKKEELFSLAVAVVLSIVQISYILNTGTHTNTPDINLEFLSAIIIKFFAFYYLRDVVSSEIVLLLGGLYILILFAIYWFYNKKDIYFYILFFLLFASIGLSVARLDPNGIHPITAGPRYFFFPFVLLSWTLLYMISKNRFYTFAIAPILLASVYISVNNFGRTHDHLEWEKHIATCVNSSGKYEIPVHYNGEKKYAGTIIFPSHTVWSIPISDRECKKLVANDMFQNKINSVEHFLYIKNVQFNKSDVLGKPKFILNSYTQNGLYDKTNVNDYEIFGSHIKGDSDIGRIKFKISKKDTFLIKTGPVANKQILRIIDLKNNILYSDNIEKTDEWMLYKFNQLLPNVFFVEISDDGLDWGEWSAVAFKKDGNGTK